MMRRASPACSQRIGSQGLRSSSESGSEGDKRTKEPANNTTRVLNQNGEALWLDFLASILHNTGFIITGFIIQEL